MDNIEKSDYEIKVFCDFVVRSGLPVDFKTIEKRNPPEPDLRCYVDGDGYVAFEVKEVCDEEVAEWVAHLYKELPDISEFKRFRDFATGSNDFVEWLKGKFSSTDKYKTDHSVELLLI